MTGSGLARAVNQLTEALDGDGDVEEAAENARSLVSAHLQNREEGAGAGRFAGADESYDSTSRVRVKMSRGEGTRDQDEWVIEGRGRNADEAAEEFDRNLRRYEEDWGSRVRALDPQPDE